MIKDDDQMKGCKINEKPSYRLYDNDPAGDKYVYYRISGTRVMDCGWSGLFLLTNGGYHGKPIADWDYDSQTFYVTDFGKENLRPRSR